MSTESIIQVTSDSDLDILIKIDAHQLNDEDKSRIREDFHQGYFQAYFYSSSGAVDLNSITAYVVTYFSYSTWQNRVLCISDFWLESTLDEAAQLEILELFRQRLFSIARLNNCKRINFHVKHSDMNQTLIRCLEKFGMRNLTREEDWNIFQLSTNELKGFIKDSPKLDDEFKIIKVEDMSLYASHIHGHIHELAVYEKLEEQFECSTEGLILYFIKEI
jgi:hypothetical protein